MRTADFDYDLPPELIAQHPVSPRDDSRLLVLDRGSGRIEHRRFREIGEYLRPGDLLVLNDTKVLRARLRAMNPRTGGNFEILLLEQMAVNRWWVMMRPGRRAKRGTVLQLLPLKECGEVITLRVLEVNAEGHRQVQFAGTPDLVEVLSYFGEVPLPPYIRRPAPNRSDEDEALYQTAYARTEGSVAAPTAGLHFTKPLLEQLRQRGVETAFVTLHVGLGTFAPVKAEELSAHHMHEEQFTVPTETAAALSRARGAGARIIAVGTTSVRVLETLARTTTPPFTGQSGRTRIFLYPPSRFDLVDGLVTNFHLPRSTLLMLVSAFASPGEERGREIMLGAYDEAIRQRYRFYSYGDAMLIL